MDPLPDDPNAERAPSPPHATPTAAPPGAYEGDAPDDARALGAPAGGGLLGSPTHRLMEPAAAGASRGLDDPAPRRRGAAVRRPADPETRTRDINPESEAPVALPVVVATPTTEEAQRIREAVTKEDLTRLAAQVTQLYERVGNELAGSREQAAQALAWLHEARTVLMARPENFPLAELRAQQARVLLQQVSESQAAARQDQGRLISVNLLWLVLFAALFALDGVLAAALLNQGVAVRPTGLPATEPPSLVWYFQPWLCVLVGGIGGALAAIVVLGRELRRRVYDPAAQVDYRLNALKGAVLGGLAYYILLGGFITAAATTTIGTDAASFPQRVQVAGSPLFILVAFIAGFAQQRLLALLPGVWSTITGEDKEKEEVAESAPVPVPVETAPAPSPPGAQPPAPSPDGASGEVTPAPVEAYDPFAGVAGAAEPPMSDEGRVDDPLPITLPPGEPETPFTGRPPG